MNFYIYSYFNRKLKEFHPPFTTDTPPEVLAAGLRRSIVLQPDKARSQNLDECRLFAIGEFDPLKGAMIPYPENKEILDCAAVFLEGDKNA